MSDHLISEDQLHAALQPYRVDAEVFENQVRALMEVSAKQPEDPYARLPLMMRGVAAFLPPIFLGATKMTVATAKAAPVSGVSKLLGYLAFPAMSLLALFGATIYSFVKIRSLPKDKSTLPSEFELHYAMEEWRHNHRWRNRIFFVLSMAIAWYGGAWLIFLTLIVSIGLTVYVLRGLGNAGLANRAVVGSIFAWILGMFGQFSIFPTMGQRDIHLWDQMWIAPIFYFGAFIVGVFGRFAAIRHRQANFGNVVLRFLGIMLFGVLLSAMNVWFLRSALWPATPERIKTYVESFEDADYPSVRFPQWETPTSWAIESGMKPDLSKPRKFFATEMAGEQNPFILGTAFRTGLIRANEIDQIKDYDQRLQRLLDNSHRLAEKQRILSFETEDWLIRAAVLRNDLTEEQKDYLAKRLKFNLENITPTTQFAQLIEPLRATQLLKVIGRPVDPAQYREQIHAMLNRFHGKSPGSFQLAGGFMDYHDTKVTVGTNRATSYAVQLMEIYGIPDDLDINWVRSFLRPQFTRFHDEEAMIAAATLNRLNALPDAKPVTWLEVIYYERTLLAAAILVALCIYATWSAPMPVREPPKGNVEAEHADGR